MGLNLNFAGGALGAPCPELNALTQESLHLGEPLGESGAIFRMRAVLEFIDASPIRAITLESAAARMYLSPSRFRFLFRRQVGMPFHKYVVSLRLQRAHHLLLTTDYKIADIAEMLGMADKSHFVRDYKRVYGVPPGASRRRIRQNRARQVPNGDHLEHVELGHSISIKPLRSDEVIR